MTQRHLATGSNPCTGRAFGRLSLCAFAVTITWIAASLAVAEKPFQYPKAKKTDQVDQYHGVQVPDPYRWLTEEDADETRAWIEAQKQAHLPLPWRAISARDENYGAD